jgi:hypothetical protein
MERVLLGKQSAGGEKMFLAALNPGEAACQIAGSKPTDPPPPPPPSANWELRGINQTIEVCSLNIVIP